MELLIVRHAQPERTVPVAGPADPALTDLGRKQAVALAAWVSRAPEWVPDRVISSPMRRARETAAFVAEFASSHVEVDDRLAEFDQGATEYVPLEQQGAAARDHVIAALATGRWGTHRFDPNQFRVRVRSAFDDLLADAASERIVVVCHGGVLNSWLSWVVGREHGVFFAPRYTSVSRVWVESEGGVRLLSLNELPHAGALEDQVSETP
ncbi:histidine phosphatase family protein [Kribbia dieselivorans]|uniref:histidine phosphatase family protein n=1 Tax=Kribbia dieselivorans TaxID=331526 RepID=UPI0008393078|nr:histidine phosphatase family protein [Kribbia dieselivorans]